MDKYKFNSLLIFCIIILSIQSYAQTEGTDKMELKDGTTIIGNVVKIRTDVVEFKEIETGLLYEYDKSEIRYIQLTNGKILTFESKPKEDEVKASNQQPVYERESDGSSVGLIILASVGAVLLVLLLIGAAAQ